MTNQLMIIGFFDEEEGVRTRSFLFPEVSPVKPQGAVRAKAVAEFRVRALADIRFDLGPIAFIVADPLTARADGQKPPEGLDLAL